MERSPHGYSQSIIYMLLYATIFLAAYGILKKKIILTHGCMLTLFIWASYSILISFNYNYAANYTYYLMSFSIVFLFCSHKRFFACLTIILFYFLSTASKISDTWILGTYFTPLELGLPLIAKEITPIATNIIIFMEMIACWFLLSRHKKLQRAVFGFFVFFHIYSGILVTYHYPTIILPSLLILFGPLFKTFDKLPSIKTGFIGWMLVVGLFLLQSISIIIPGDKRLTMEGNYYGLFMYEANHQCYATLKENGSQIWSHSDANANHRCNPYVLMKQAQRFYCPDTLSELPKYHFEVLHSINGDAFYQIVSEGDLCALTYKPFSKNDWIKTKETAPALYRPYENYNY